MTPESPQTLLRALQWRYATKQFDANRTIPEETWKVLEQSLVLTPSSFGLQPWRFLIVKNPALRSQLREVSWGQPQLTDASHLVVLTARTDLDSSDVGEWIDCLAATQGGGTEALAPLRGMIEGFVAPMSREDRFAWNSRQVYIALGQLMTSAAVLGIDSCPLEGIDAAAYDRILGLEGGPYATRVGCALGYRHADDKYAAKPKARFDAAKVVQTLD